MIGDDELFKMTDEIDKLIIDLLIKYNIEPLNLTGIVMARLIHLNKNSDEFYKLINSISSREHEKSEQRVLQ